ncbi:leucine-rich repeat protein [Acinetobacter sp. YH12140]|uniref:leucine-rich repeat protein n=1 Tax=Acinetobacter sp. YH12140 TaxID=2601124 RepID=UPI0015D0D2E3|nr:leucine-rich repeat protein [Acinetobacter sp. YH12140]
MTIYTGTADANGDFIVPFSASYTSGQKVTVTAEKDGASQSIELFAPSDTTGGGVIQFSGTLENFPANIGVVTLNEINGAIGDYAFSPHGNANSIWKRATGLVINAEVTALGYSACNSWTLAQSLVIKGAAIDVGAFCFNNWTAAAGLELNAGVNLTLGNSAFQGWSTAKYLKVLSNVAAIPGNCFFGWTQLLTAEFSSTVTSIGSSGCGGWSACNQIIMHSIEPPTITTTTFTGLKTGCIFKVPAASVAAYQAADNWSAYASQIQAI